MVTDQYKLKEKDSPCDINFHYHMLVPEVNVLALQNKQA